MSTLEIIFSVFVAENNSVKILSPLKRVLKRVQNFRSGLPGGGILGQAALFQKTMTKEYYHPLPLVSRDSLSLFLLFATYKKNR